MWSMSLFHLSLVLSISRLSLALPWISHDVELVRRQKSGDRLCTMGYHTSTIADDTLFLMGGEVQYQTPGTENYDAHASRRLIKIDLSKPWDAESPIIADNLTFPDATPNRNCYAGLWQDGKKLYYYGGEKPSLKEFDNQTVPAPSVYEYDIALNKWTTKRVKQLPARTCGSWVQDKDNNGYYLGGIKGPKNDPKTKDGFYLEPGMVQFPLGSDKAEVIDTTSLNTYGTMAGGTMVYIDSVGKKGIFVAFGGVSPSTSTDFRWGGGTDSYNDMNKISIYNVETQKWHQQMASGNVRPRIQFCSIVQKAPDNSQFFVYIYGGYNAEYNIDQVDVLSIPAFVWTSASSAGFRARFQHTCNVHKNQMILSGGIVVPVNEDSSRNKDRDKRICEPKKMFRVFDTNTHKWTDKFSPEGAAYKVNADLVKIVGGKAEGGATVKQPAGGFTDPDLESIFKSATTGGATNGGGQDSGNGEEPKEEEENKGGVSSTGAIAGGVIGGLGAIAIIAGLLFFFLRKRKQNKGGDIPLPPEPKNDHGNENHLYYNNNAFNNNSNNHNVNKLGSIPPSATPGSYYKPDYTSTPPPQHQNVSELHAEPNQNVQSHPPVELQGSPAHPMELPTEANQRQPLLH